MPGVYKTSSFPIEKPPFEKMNMDQTLKALIIDDNPVARALLAGLLQKVRPWRLHTTVCATGEEAVGLVRQQMPDVIFVDFRLHQETGTDLILRLREQGCRCGFVLFTGTTGDEALLEALRAGADDYLHKTDLSVGTLTRCLHHTLKKLETSRALDTLMRELQEAKEGLEERVKARTTQLNQAKEEAEHATQLKDQFVSLVAHDLRGPFTTILGFLELLVSDRKNPLNKKQKRLLGWVTESSQRMLRMVEEILNISRLKTGKIILNPRFVNARFISEKIVADIHPVAKQKQITLNNHLPENFRIHVDPELFGEVLRNLLSNAVKFCQKGDAIDLMRPPGPPLRIAVRDTGVGISKKSREKLFNLEARTSTTGTAGEQGTGFGLPFSLDLMKAHGGDLTVESEPGKGSTFYTVLPEVIPWVLVVDDDSEFRKLVMHHLEPEQVQTTPAKNGQAALRLLKEQPHHLLICDIQMPDMDGFELLTKLRSQPETRILPTILITADDSIATREKAFQLGADDFVTKPLDPNDFIPRIRRFLG